MANKLIVTEQDQKNVKEIVIKNGVAKGSKVRIEPTGTKFAKAFDILVNGILFAKYHGIDSDTGLYSYTLVHA